MEKFIQYENGLRLIVEQNSSLRSVACGIWVRTGSSNETKANNGISHFTEHMLFKGTNKMSAFDIANAFEYLGANINAFTSKECTCYYFKAIEQNAEQCVELLSHMFFQSTFPKEELDKERKVILEEINMVEDSPEEICNDLLATSLYGNSPLGMTIIGTIDNVKRFSKDDILSYMGESYCADNIVVSIAGSMSLEAADKIVKKYILPHLPKTCASSREQKYIQSKSTHTQRIKDFEQSNIALAFPSIKLNDDRSVIQAACSTILGGAMSSRLFQAVREELGLAYSIYSVPSGFVSNGSFNILVNISPENTLKALDAINKELLRFEEGISDTELHRAKTQLKSSSIFAKENVLTVMLTNGKLLSVANEQYDIDEKIKKIDALTQKDILDFAHDTLSCGTVCTAYVGKETGVDILEVFTKS